MECKCKWVRVGLIQYIGYWFAILVWNGVANRESRAIEKRLKYIYRISKTNMYKK